MLHNESKLHLLIKLDMKYGALKIEIFQVYVGHHHVKNSTQSNITDVLSGRGFGVTCFQTSG